MLSSAQGTSPPAAQLELGCSPGPRVLRAALLGSLRQVRASASLTPGASSLLRLLRLCLGETAPSTGEGGRLFPQRTRPAQPATVVLPLLQGWLLEAQRPATMGRQTGKGGPLALRGHSFRLCPRAGYNRAIPATFAVVHVSQLTSHLNIQVASGWGGGPCPQEVPREVLAGRGPEWGWGQSGGVAAVARGGRAGI